MNTHKYTTSPNEVPAQSTVPAPADVVALVQADWPALNLSGARVLTSQFLHETGGARFCFNWNLGNIKAGELDPHMFLLNVWELLVPAAAQQQVANSGGLARIATEAECQQHGWAHSADTVVVVFQPPHAQCRFRAYASLAEGAARWLSIHERIAAQRPEYVSMLNLGDVASAAHILKLAHYYSGDEVAYAKSMASIFRTLTPPAPAPTHS